MPKTKFTIYEEYERERQRNPLTRDVYGRDKYYSEEEWNVREKKVKDAINNKCIGKKTREWLKKKLGIEGIKRCPNCGTEMNPVKNPSLKEQVGKYVCPACGYMKK